MATLVENKGTVQLFSNGDGSYYVVENGTQSPIYDMGASSPWKNGDIVAADYYNGCRAVVFSGGHVWYMNAGWQKANVGPNGNSTDQVAQDQINNVFLSGTGSGSNPAPANPVPAPVAPAPTYNISGPASVNEGEIAMFPLQTTGLPAGTMLTYNISGIDPSRIVGGQLTGSLSIGANGTVPIPLPLAANNKTDGPTTVSISLSNGQATFSAQINDTSTGSPTAAGPATLVEGFGAVKLFQNSDGTYSVTENGVTSTIFDMGMNTSPFKGAGSLAAADYYNGYRVVIFNGGHVWYMNSSWHKDSVGPNGNSADQLTPDQINNIFLSGSGGTNTPQQTTNTATYTITGPTGVNEGEIAMFMLNTTGVPAGTALSYNISGIDPSRIVGGQLTGTVGVGANGSVQIPLPLAANNKTDGPTNVTVSLSNGKASFSARVNDTSTGVATTVGTLVESFGSVKLYQNSDGSMSVEENGQGVRSVIKHATGMAAMNPGFIAADVINGVREAVLASGSVWYFDSAWQKAPLGPQGRDTGELSATELQTLFLSPTAPPKAINTPPVANQVSTITLDPLVTSAVALNLAAPTDANGDTLTIRVDSLPSNIRLASNGGSLYVGQSFSVADFTNLTATLTTGTTTTSLSLGQLGFTVSDGKGGSTSSSVAFTAKSTTAKAITKTTGDDGDNQLQGTSGDDSIAAGAGNDKIIATAGNDVIDGGSGKDTLVFSSNNTGVSFSASSDGAVKLSYGGSNYTLTGVERVQFSGKSYALDIQGNAGNAAKLITAAFGSSMVKEYLGIGISLADGGLSLEKLNDFVINLGILPTSSKDFVNLVFSNVVGRAPNQFESLVYSSMIDNGVHTRSSLLLLAESTSLVSDAVTNISLAGVALEYTPSVF